MKLKLLARSNLSDYIICSLPACDNTIDRVNGIVLHLRLTRFISTLYTEQWRILVGWGIGDEDARHPSPAAG